MTGSRTTVVLLSGGIDSTVAAAIAQKSGFQLCGLSFDYGQVHRVELTAAQNLAQSLGFERHLIFPLDLARFHGSSLLGDGEIPKGRSEREIQTGIPSTYVPGRNLIFLSIAAAWAEILGAGAVVIGAHALDYSGYPDCRPEFMDAFQHAANLATKAGTEKRLIRIWPPLIRMGKAEIIKTGAELGVDFSLTLSCYDPDSEGRACGQCDSCLIRKKGFAQAGIPTPPAIAEPGKTRKDGN